MSRPRAQSESSKTPHSVSLKVLRLSRPSLSLQYPLPKGSQSIEPAIDTRAALSSPSSNVDDEFILSSQVTLPAAFGATHVGETFSCALCANNEVQKDNGDVSITSLRITAEMQSPSGTYPLDLGPTSNDTAEEDDVPPKSTLQRIVRFDLNEEGNHVLAVTVTYTETRAAEEGQASAGRARTFRKLYQFVAQQLLSVRTKTQLVPSRNNSSPTKYTLEAQLENLGDGPIVLDAVAVTPKPGFKSRSLNLWDNRSMDGKVVARPVLNGRDVMQVAFLLTEQDEESSREPSQTREGRVILGQMSIQWRSNFGEQGSLSTGWLTGKKR